MLWENVVSELLRQYEPHECEWVPPDKYGYPFAWSQQTEVHGLGQPGDGPLILPPIKDLIREQACNRCLRCGHPYRVGEVGGGGEWSPCDDECQHRGPLRVLRTGELLPPPESSEVARVAWPDETIQAAWRILTVHHLDEDKANCRWYNLAALCQRCHLRMQRAVIMDRPWHYEHSEWFRPFAAGFYAFKYLNEDLTREETTDRLDELLALERRWTQEALC